MPIEIIYNIEDKSGTHGSTSVKVEDDITVAGLTGFATGWATALNNIILGKILSATAHILANISALTDNTILEGADVEHIAKFQFVTAIGTRVDCNIPAMSETNTGTITQDEIVTGSGAPADFISAMEDGISVSGALIQPCDVGGESIVSLVFAREGARNSGARR